MATYKKGINGAFNGKLGTVVGIKWRGGNYMRSLPRKSGKPATEAQLNQRFVFALVNGWLRPLRDLIWIGFQSFKGTKTPMNAAVSLVMKEAITGENRANYAIEFAKVILSRGELLISIIREVIKLIDDLLNIKWESAPESVFCKGSDRATFVVYSPSNGQFITFKDIAERADGEVTLQLPPGFRDNTLHCWMSYVNEAGDAVSTSIYVGELSEH
ncbi:DUF6266 family protein [Pedobacter frigoris]|uniref:DUF6266 family protein n=1 Tax=Pedobacter frigoris TaxID=2571272 RepID=UPI002931019A|nr:DUF6266 family protein [Pedobacter frigoris]